MEKIFVFLLFAIIEYLITSIITNSINIINYDYISLNYTSFKFSTSTNSPTGLNTLIKIFLPSIYIIILSGILYNLSFNKWVEDIFLITIIYYLIKWFIITIVFNRTILINWKNEIICFLFSFFISWFIYKIFISKTTEIFISVNEIRDGIWLGIIMFMLEVIITTIYNKSYLNIKDERCRIKRYIIKKYYKFNLKYDDILKTKNKTVRTLTYAIMIYENYNRPIIIRFFEYIKFILNGKASLGIMQVSTTKFIANRESVELGYNIVKNNYNSLKKMSLEEKLKKTIFMYNKSNKYVDEVLNIYYVLSDKNIIN